MGVNIYHFKLFCYWTTFTGQVSPFLSLWYVVCFTVDRFIAIWFPCKEKIFCTTLKAKFVILLLAFVAIVVFLNISLTARVEGIGTKSICFTLMKFRSAIRILRQVDMFINGLIPYTFLVGVTLVCAVRLTIEGKMKVLCHSPPHIIP